ncbi:hypothetical protein H0H87_005839 [Tephrocybe sp. NHM501043]|nr:hypothetical protein H0H87_005839 [Tephrocybe sp. NHM501043]
MAFASRPGCPLCSIVSSASHATPNSPRSPSFPPGSTQAEVLWRDDNFTIFREKAHPLSSRGHIIAAFKYGPLSVLCRVLLTLPSLHVPSIYTLSSSDLPLLVNIRNLSTPHDTPLHPHEHAFRIGFITPPFKDSKIPVTDHLHCHAYIGPPDLMGWWRGIAYGPLAWYPIDDLIAEIRESVSNNRVKSGYENRRRAPIDLVPHAGARAGTADGIETTDSGIANHDAELEEADGNTPARLLSPRSPEALLTPQSQIPTLRV